MFQPHNTVQDGMIYLVVEVISRNKPPVRLVRMIFQRNLVFWTMI